MIALLSKVLTLGDAKAFFLQALQQALQSSNVAIHTRQYTNRTPSTVLVKSTGS
jgi:hypothetical protein